MARLWVTADHVGQVSGVKDEAAPPWNFAGPDLEAFALGKILDE